jgi:hypothetical protein
MVPFWLNVQLAILLKPVSKVYVHHGFLVGCVAAQSLVFCVVFCRSLFDQKMVKKLA